jgi:hypothetical protein
MGGGEVGDLAALGRAVLDLARLAGIVLRAVPDASAADTWRLELFERARDHVDRDHPDMGLSDEQGAYDK